jgi:sugar phosphate isomerase/epimerase
MLSRRSMVMAVAAARRRRFRWAICSETFQGMRFAEACAAAKRCGYDGIEVEPAHLGADPAALTPAERRAAREAMKAAGVAYVGIHNILKAPAGLHLAAPDAPLRSKSWDYFRRVIDLAADLGPKPVMVFGSSRQRNAVEGTTPTDAVERLVEGLSGVAAQAESRGVSILIEPLAPHLCNVINSLEEAVVVVRRVNSRAVRSMFDTHNTAAEKLPHAETIRKYLPHLGHVHLNEMDGRYPGAADFPFGEVLRALEAAKYKGWMSVEVFDFKPDGETVARRALEYLRKVEG